MADNGYESGFYLFRGAKMGDVTYAHDDIAQFSVIGYEWGIGYANRQRGGLGPIEISLYI